MDPNLQPQPNPGTFMSTAAGQSTNQGGALMRLMQLRQLGATPQAGATPLPAAPVEEGSPVSMRSMDQAQKQMVANPQTQPQQMPQPQQAQSSGIPNTTYDPHGEALKIAMSALGNYVQNHGKALEAANDVPRKQAEAKMLASRAQLPASPVGA